MEHLDLQVLSNEKETLEILRYNPAILASAANQLIFQAIDVSNRIQATVQEAQHNRLSTQLLPGETIVKMYKFLENAAKEKGLELLISQPVDLYQTELSYFYREEDQMLNLFLHIPMVRPNSILQFYQLVPFPIASDIRNNSSMVPKVEKDMIAVGPDHQYQIVGHSDLTSCTKYGTVYLCEERHTTSTNMDKTCLGALYQEKWPLIHKLCEFQFVPADEYVFKLSSNQWIISSPTPLTTSVKCNKVFNSVNLKPLSIVTVPEGCVMHLREHIIHPGSSILDTDSEVKHFQWSWNPEELFPYFNTEAFNHTLYSLRDEVSLTIGYINHETKLRQNSDDKNSQSVKEEITNLKNENEIHPNYTLYILIAFIIVILIIAIVLCKLNSNSIKDYLAVKGGILKRPLNRPEYVQNSHFQYSKRYSTPMEHMNAPETPPPSAPQRVSTTVI